MSIPTSNLILEFYENAGLTKRVYNIQSDIPTNVGESQTWTLFVKNAIRDELRNITFYTDDKDVSFTPNSISYLAPHQSVQLNVVWSPKKDRRIALKCTIFASCQVIIKP